MDKKTPEIIVRSRGAAVPSLLVYHAPRVMDYGDLTALTSGGGGRRADGAASTKR
jgi:hypothetical protein